VPTKKGLGRSFSSLIPEDLLDESFDPTAKQDEQVSELRNIKINEITPDPNQPRRLFDETALEELVTSITEHGVLQPIIVTPSKTGYTIVAGERRYRAALKAGLTKIPALVRTLSNQHKLELSLIENIQRRDLNPIEMATAYVKLKNQFNLSLEQIGQRVGKTVSGVSNVTRLLQLPESVRQALAEGRMNEGQARPLIKVPHEIIEEILPQLLKEEWSARKVEQFTVQLKKNNIASDKKPAKKITVEPYLDDTKRLVSRFKTDVKVRTNSRGAGVIMIEFKSDKDFQRLQKILNS
jgi:ParB family transcriptional regulator, chromosome partitioning protein